MYHIDLFEAPDGDLYMVPDEGDTVYGHWAEATANDFSFVARNIIEDTEGYRDGYGSIHSYTSVAALLADPATVHLADYDAGHEDPESHSTEHQMHLYGRPKEVGITFLGPVCAYLALGKPLPAGPRCGRCIETTKLIGIYDVPPWGSHFEVQHTIIYQCPACGWYRQTGFEEGGDWTGETLSYRKLVRLFPDPFDKNGRLRMMYEADGRRLNLDGEALHPGQSFGLFLDGSYRFGRLEVGGDRYFYFIFSDPSRPDMLLLPGMRARLD